MQKLIKRCLRTVIPGLFICLLTPSCSPGSHSPSEIRNIFIQPIGFKDKPLLEFIQSQIADFFHCSVHVLENVDMPLSFQNLTKGERYSADSILTWLSGRKNDSVSILVGLTSQDIYIADKDENGHIRKPVSKYAVWGILGLGNCPGSVCVISDARFRLSSGNKYNHRLKTIVIHEIGHNLGLPHCKSLHCIMNDANEQISTVDSSGSDFCESCKKILTRKYSF